MKAFINGTFDVFHHGHLTLINTARRLIGPGGFLLVSIDSDRRVREKKGKTRPVCGQDFRRELLNSLKQVDFVTVFDSDEELVKTIQYFKPDVMVKGSDYQDQPILGREYCSNILFVKRTNDSTTKIIKNISSR